MSLNELLPAVQALPRPEKYRLVQILVADLASQEGVPLLQAGGEYPIWSPFDASDAAAALQGLLQQEGKRAP
jgi:hypothetical protein